MASTATIPLIFFASVLSTTTFVNGDGPLQLWCVPRPGTTDKQLQANLDYACAAIDCRDIQPGGSCMEPNTIKDHAAYAMNTFYNSLGKQDSFCNFNGTGHLVQNDPSTPTCKFFSGKNYTIVQNSKAWCVATRQATDQQLQGSLDFACGKGIDCKPIQAGGACFEPNTVRSHASYAMNTYFQTQGKQDFECDFSGTAQLVVTDPSYDGCKYT